LGCQKISGIAEKSLSTKAKYGVEKPIFRGNLGANFKFRSPKFGVRKLKLPTPPTPNCLTDDDYQIIIVNTRAHTGSSVLTGNLHKTLTKRVYRLTEMN